MLSLVLHIFTKDVETVAALIMCGGVYLQPQLSRVPIPLSGLWALLAFIERS